MDHAQKISAELWKWYKACRDAEKDQGTWERYLDEADRIIRQYEGMDYIFARDMFLLFLDRIECMERKKKEGECKAKK